MNIALLIIIAILFVLYVRVSDKLIESRLEVNELKMEILALRCQLKTRESQLYVKTQALRVWQGQVWDYVRSKNGS